jgi:hypothetical protein
MKCTVEEYLVVGIVPVRIKQPEGRKKTPWELGRIPDKESWSCRGACIGQQ